MAIIRKPTGNKCWKGYAKKGTLLHCQWECKLVWILWRIGQKFLKKIKQSYRMIQQSHSSIYQEKTLIGKDACTPVFIAPLFTTAKMSQFSSVTQSHLTLCDPMDCRTPGLPVHHELLEFTQNHVHWVGDAIQPPHPLSTPSPPAFNQSQHQGKRPISQFFASGGQSIWVSASASVLPMNIQDWLPLGWTVWISLQSKGLSRVFTNTIAQKHQFFGAQLSL